MANLYMKQQVFSWRDRFYVKNENGDDVYYVEGEIFSFGKRLHVYDKNGTQVAFIGQKLLTFMPRFSIEIGGEFICDIVQNFTFFSQSYRLEHLPLRLEGDFFAHDYSLLSDNGEVVMRLEKKWFTWGDSYAMQIRGDASELLCLCVALAVDCTMAQKND